MATWVLAVGALLAALVITGACGLTWRLRSGRVRPARTRSNGEETLLEALPADLRRVLTERSDADAPVTLLQLSTAFCAPCRHARVLLERFAGSTPGVRHVEVDLTHHPDWATPLRVHTTPMTLVLDGAGAELFRVPGVPRRADLAEALRPHLP
ncbi:TlpA family protein disulfide reductase [Salinifilum ghardaiensis]